MDKVRAAVIGYGNMGSAHAEHIFRGDVEGMELAAVCDTDGRKCEAARQSFGGIKTEMDYRKILAMRSLLLFRIRFIRSSRRKR